jgi:hypothetical protein
VIKLHRGHGGADDADQSLAQGQRSRAGTGREAEPRRTPYALASLHLVDRNDPIVDIVAKKII